MTPLELKQANAQPKASPLKTAVVAHQDFLSRKSPFLKSSELRKLLAIAVFIGVQI